MAHLPIVLRVSSAISGVVAAYQQIISRIRMDNVPGVSAFRQPTTESAGRLTGIDKNTESMPAVRIGAWPDGKPAIRGSIIVVVTAAVTDTKALPCQIVLAMNDPARPSGPALVPPPRMVADASRPA
jgi:hypothetical protein